LFIRYLKHFLLTSTSWALSASDDILVGGQAVIEGVMMRSPNGYSVAVRRQDGTIKVLKNVLKTVGEQWRIFKMPFLRGVGVLGQALVLGIKALRFSAEEAIQDEEIKKGTASTRPAAPKEVSSWFIAGNLAMALGINILLFVVLPLLLTQFLQSRFGFENSIVFSTIDGFFRVAMFVTFLLLVSRLADMKRVFQYHGAEHKTVYNFEARESLTVDHARKFSTFHPRCGTSFLLVVMIVSVLVFSLIYPYFDSLTGRLLSRIALLPLIAGISYEIIRYSAKKPDSIIRFVTFPGLLLQRITTQPPDDRQLETAIRALEEALTV
jgi:uncharacterized protein YqhQ